MVLQCSRSKKVKGLLLIIINDQENELTVTSRELMQELYGELVELEEKVAKIDKRLKLLCKNNEICQRILAIPGIGELTATAIIAAVPNANEFKNRPHMAAWLGLVPQQSSSGHKQILLGISKRGDRYLRTLLIHGARAALCFCKNLKNKYGDWLAKKKTSLSLNKAAVALANKNARIIWALLKTGNEFNSNQEMSAA